MIDGVDTTNLLNGTSGKTLPPDFVDTVQAKASGYAAEYRASLGGVISAITQIGRQPVPRQRRHLLHQRRPAGRRAADAPAEPVEPEHRRVRDDADRRLRPVRSRSATSAVRSRSDRVWFFVGYDPSWTSRTRTVRFSAPSTVGTFSQKPITNIVNYNVTGQITPQPSRPIRRIESARQGRLRAAGVGPGRRQHGEPGALSVGDPPRRVERLLLGRGRLGRQQPDLR